MRQKKSRPDSLPANNLAELFLRNDANWYLNVVRNGYNYQEDPGTGQAHGNLAFYPVYPFAVKGLRWAVPDAVTAGYLVSNLAFIVALALLWQLAALNSVRRRQPPGRWRSRRFAPAARGFP